MTLKCATFNVLANAYTSYGDYSYVEPGLLLPGARTQGIIDVVNNLDAEVVAMQEAEELLLREIGKTGVWQTFWSPKGHGKPDGCLTLVKRGIDVDDFDTYHYTDKHGHIVQTLNIGNTTFANTHIKWSPDSDPNHLGVSQTSELLKLLCDEDRAVIFADCNDRPGGPVRGLIENAGFVNVLDDEPTAFVNNSELAALDLISLRGLTGRQIATRKYDITKIPNRECPSDHIPLVAELDI